MALFEWREEYSVNVDEIDQQHKKLIQMINDLHTAMKEKKAKDVIEDVLKRMESYVEEHFNTEEKYFDKFDYPEAEEHIQEHDQFVEKVEEFIEDYMDGKMMLSMKLINFLKDWLTNHIKGTDQKYSEFFNEHGLS